MSLNVGIIVIVVIIMSLILSWLSGKIEIYMNCFICKKVLSKDNRHKSFKGYVCNECFSSYKEIMKGLGGPQT